MKYYLVAFDDARRRSAAMEFCENDLENLEGGGFGQAIEELEKELEERED